MSCRAALLRERVCCCGWCGCWLCGEDVVLCCVVREQRAISAVRESRFMHRTALNTTPLLTFSSLLWTIMADLHASVAARLRLGFSSAAACMRPHSDPGDLMVQRQCLALIQAVIICSGSAFSLSEAGLVSHAHGVAAGTPLEA